MPRTPSPRAAAHAAVVALLAAVLVLAAPAVPALDPVTGRAAPAGAASEVDDYLARINDLRAQHGRAPLAVHADLAAGAQAWSVHLASLGSLAHDPNVGASITGWASIAENVGMGPSTDAVWQALVSSPSHRANMLDPGITHVGVGVAHGAVQFTTHRFARLEPGLSATVPPQPAPTATPPPAAPSPTVAAAPSPTLAPPPTPTTTTAPAPQSPVEVEPRRRAGAVLEALAGLSGPA